MSESKTPELDLVGDAAKRESLLSRAEWRPITAHELHAFSLFRPTGTPSKNEAEFLCRAINAGHITLDVFGVPMHPESAFSVEDGETYRRTRGGSKHKLATVAARRWLAHTFPDSATGVDGDYPAGMHDVGIESLRVAVECGYTDCGKVETACGRGWTVVLMPYHLPEGLIAFRFTPVRPAAIANAVRARIDAESARITAEERLRTIASGHSMPVKLAECERRGAHPKRSRCVGAATCSGEEADSRGFDGNYTRLLLERPRYFY